MRKLYSFSKAKLKQNLKLKRRIYSLPLLPSHGCQYPWTDDSISVSVVQLSPPLLPVKSSLGLAFLRTLVIGFRTHLDHLGSVSLARILNLITPFACKVVFTL